MKNTLFGCLYGFDCCIKRDAHFRGAKSHGGEARAVACEVLHNTGDHDGKLGAQYSGVLIEVVQHIKYSENSEFLPLLVHLFLLK